MSYDNFNKILELVYARSPLQKKKIKKSLSAQDGSFFSSAEEFSVNYINYLQSEQIPLEYAVDAYLKMCGNMLKSQISFMKTGKYPVEISGEAYENVYSKETEMKSYMVGLALSQFLWSSHYRIYSYLVNIFRNNSDTISSYLEIGPGHGLFLEKAMTHLKKDAELTVVDISATSIEITRSIMRFFHQADFGRIKFHNVNFLELTLDELYDFIMMGEVIEHVNNPDKFLVKVKNLLSENGRAFISTCVNCPSIDHVYHFNTVEEIRDMLNACGLQIRDEQALPVEDLPIEEIIDRRITINYCALVGRA